MRTVVLPIGGGGLASGVAAILKQADPTIRIVGVQSELCAPIADPGARSMICGLPSLTASPSSARGVDRPSDRSYVDELCTVDEDAIAEAIVALMQHGKLVVEGAGAVSVAALLSNVIELDESEVVVAVLSGATSISIAFRPRAGCTSPVKARRSTLPPRCRIIPAAWLSYWWPSPKVREMCSRSSTSARPVSGVSTKPASRSCFRHGALSIARRS